MQRFAFRFSLNSEQRKHAAKSLDTLSLGRLAAFGYVGLSSGNGLMMGVSVLLAVLLEVAALSQLRNVGDSE